MSPSLLPSGALPSDSPVGRVLVHYTGLGWPVQAKWLGGAGGYSGADLWQITTPSGRFCLKQWPAEHPSAARLTFIHSVLRRSAQEGLPFVPAAVETATGGTFVALDGRLWELAPWMPGKADFSEDPSPARLRAALTALARFHQATAEVSDGSGRRLGPAPVLLERRERVERLLAGEFSELQAAAGRRMAAVGRGQLDIAARQTLALAPPLLADLRGPLQRAAAISLPLQPAIRDIWHDHVLFTGNEVTGIVDYGALRIDTPLADVARLVGSLVGDDQPRRAEAFTAYAALRPLTDEQRWLISLLDRSGVVLGALNWLTWLYVDQRSFADTAAVAQRLEAFNGRMRGWGLGAGD